MVVCVIAACGDDVQSAEGDASSSSTDASPTTSMPTTSSSTEDPDSSGTDPSSSSESSSGSESSTGDAPLEPTDARVYYTVTQGTSEQQGTWLVDVLAGVLGEPVRVAEDVPYPVSASTTGRWLADAVTVESRVWLRLIDRDAVPIVPASVIDLDATLDFFGIGQFEFASDDSAIALFAGGVDGAGLFTLALGDDGPGAPWPADAELPADTEVRDLVGYLPGDTHLVLVTHDSTTDTDALVLAPARADVQDGIVPIATSPSGEGLSDATATSDASLVAYRVGSDASMRGYVVDLETLPATPVELVLPSPDARLTHLELAPDDSGVVYTVRVPMEPQDQSWTYWSALEDGVPQAPIELAPDHGSVHGVRAWSPDARWMELTAVGEPDTRLLVRLDDGVPSVPFDLGPIVDNLGDTRRAFTSDGWYYYLTQGGDDLAFLRVDVDGDEPGPPQPVHVVGDVFEWEISTDASTLVISSADQFAGEYQVFAIDLTGDEPGDPVKLNGPTGPGEWADYLDVSPDGRAVAYHRRAADNMGGYGHYVDRATPEMALTLADGIRTGIPSVRALP